MELFDEAFGAVYSAVSRILREAPLTKTQIRRILLEELSVDGAEEAEQKLLDGTWPFLIEKGGKYHSALTHKPAAPLAFAERSYLAALLQDPHSRLFLADEQLEKAKAALGDAAPLFSASDFFYYDRFADGDIPSEEYRARFQIIITALQEESWLRISYLSRKGKHILYFCFPLTLEYSGKDDRFRLHCVNRFGACQVLNLSSIQSAEKAETPDSYTPVPDKLTSPRCGEPVVIEVTPERSALYRFMLEFSYLEKRCELDGNGGALVKLWYPKNDETEILIRLLSFGPVIRVLSPSSFVEKMRERVLRQALQTDPE